MTEQPTPAQSSSNQQFVIEGLYTRSVSFEAPNKPYGFSFEQWKPAVNINLDTSFEEMKDKEHSIEVFLHINVTVKCEEKTAFIAEVKEAGIFHLEGFKEPEKKRILGTFCPSILYPYAREAISGMVTRAGFPQLLLAPINFDAVYEEKLRKETKGNGQAGVPLT